MEKPLLEQLKHRMHSFEPTNRVGLEMTADEWIGAEIIDLLEENRLVGEVLLQVQRRFRFDLPGMLGLKWVNNEIQLEVNPLQLAKLQQTADLRDLLTHEALHIIWQHPVRYAEASHANNVRLATDVAVNQYVESAPAGTMTLAKLEALIGRSLPAKEDSATYLSIVNGAELDAGQTESNQGRVDQDSDADDDDQQPGEPVTDLHTGWEQPAGTTNLNEQDANLQSLLITAWDNVSDRQRGLLPGDVREQLERLTSPPVIKWRSIIKQTLGKMPMGKRPSFARFNRRQPVRMDLPGQVTNMVMNVAVFVDNSGSMGEREISYLLNELCGILRVYEAIITVYSFDTIVHDEDAYGLSGGGQINFQRIGGGGTSFQSIFDFLHQKRCTNDSALAVILTDGWGEADLNVHRFTNVVWVLTTDRESLSVTEAVGRVTSLKDDPKFNQWQVK